MAARETGAMSAFGGPKKGRLSMSHHEEATTAATANVSSREPRAERPATPQKSRKPRGFAAMDPALVSRIARKGGRAAHEAGTAHQFTSEEARVAGRKGGVATHAKRTATRETPNSDA